VNDKPLVTRYEGNPILTKHDIPYVVETVHNAGATKYNGQYILLFRSHLRNGRSIIGIARSDDGYKFQADPKPFMVPSTEIEFAVHEEYGVEDPRICTIAGEHYITYSAYSRFGVRIGLAKTHDFKTVERVSLISQADMRNVVIFPDTFNGRYARLDRPHSEINPWCIWLSWSPDLIHWGDSVPVIQPVPYHWDEMKIGPGATPIKTAQRRCRRLDRVAGRSVGIDRLRSQRCFQLRRHRRGRRYRQDLLGRCRQCHVRRHGKDRRPGCALPQQEQAAFIMIIDFRY
jgi:predicted GH43/DUF377 family glycosyl hydrolase